MDKDALELKKLELDLQKVPLEVQKLAAEVADLQFKLRIGQSTALLERWKVYPAYLTLLVSIFLGGITFLQYLAQQEREQKFKVSQELIKLMEQINADDPPVQRNAALALAIYGHQAAPILVESLANDHTESVNRAIIKSLQSIIASEKEAENIKSVLETLADSAEFLIRHQLKETRPDVNMLLAHVRALGLVGAEASAHKMLTSGLRERYKEIFLEARRMIRESPPASMEDKMKLLDEAIDEQLKGLSS